MRIAAIDSGTNTLLMLIADVQKNGEVQIIKEFHNMPRAGEGVFTTKLIREEKISALIDIYSKYRAAATEFGAEKIIAGGTNVFRIAENAKKVIEKVKNATGIEIKVLTGEEEAELSFLGATADFNRSHLLAVIDIGGGSTEVTCKKDNNLIFKKSFPTGVVTIRENFVGKEHLSSDNLSEIYSHTRDIFSDLKAISVFPEAAVAIAGTPTTLISMAKGLVKYDAKAIHKEFLSIEMIEKLLQQFINLPFGQYSKYGKIVAGREDLMGGGSAILKTVLEVLNLNGAFVSTTGLRYGMVLKYAEENL
ncbi:MAG: hypothetical protein H3C46_02730 [Ignavibacteria bacterium]|nr:hypothetical protein [Ignavibacteria bacterium]